MRRTPDLLQKDDLVGVSEVNASSRFHQVLTKEPNYPAKSIDLRQASEVVALAGVDLYFMRNAILLKKPLQPSGFFDRDNRILLAVQN